MIQRKSVVLLLPLLLATFTGLLAQQQAQKSFSGVTKVSILSTHADVEVLASNSDEARVTAVYSGESAPSMNLNGSTLSLSENGKNGNSQVEKWTVYVPNETKVQFNTASGEIRAEGYNGSFEGNTGSGDVTLSSLAGLIRVNTGSGDVKVTGVSGSIGLNTGSGYMEFSRVSGHINANTGSGDLTVSDFRSTEASTFNTGSGKATVTLAGDLEHSLSLNSGSGNSTLDLNGHQIKGKLVMECSEEKGEIKAPFAFDETEVVNKNKNYPILRKTKNMGSGTAEVRIATGSGAAIVSR